MFERVITAIIMVVAVAIVASGLPLSSISGAGSGALGFFREPRTILAFGSGCSARAEVSPRSRDRFDAWPASARSFARCHTESTRERTQAGAAAIRSS